MKIKYWGARGSLPAPGPATAKIGGNTSCVEVIAAGTRLIFDMGSGARVLGGMLLKEMPVTAHVFFTHMHHDHNMGFPFFVPHFIPGNTLYYYGERKGKLNLEEQLEQLFRFPYFPVDMRDMPANMEFITLHEGQKVRFSDDLVVMNRKLNHPDGCLGFRVECIEDGVKKVYTHCTDTEHFTVTNWKITELAKDADVLTYDAQYTDEQYPQKTTWGHSTWSAGVREAMTAGARRLVLFHHDPMHDDNKILEIEALARQAFPNTQAAYEGLEIVI